MTVRKYSSRAQQSTLASSLAAGATTMTLASGGGAKVMGGKTLTGSQTYTLVIDPDTSLEEIVDVTVYSSGDTLTITRARDGSTDVAHSAGAVVRHMVIGRDLQEANDHIEASAAVHGLSGTVVGTSDTQTLTNKTLTAPTVSGATISGTVTSTATITGGTVNPTTLQQGGVQAVTTTGSQTLTNKTLTTPTIADFSNATHDHTNSAGGGALSTSAISGIQEYIEDTVGAMVSSNTESGIAVTYDDATGKLNFNVDDPTITLDGDITGSATMTNLGNTTITTAISSGSIVNADINASAGIAYSKLSLNSSITSADLVDGTIVNADINASANIALSKLATDPLARANHTGTQTASTISDFDTQVRTSKVTDLAAPTGSFSMNSQKITNVATPTDSGDAATKGYIDQEITDLINGAPGTLDTLKEIADQIQAGGTFYDSVVFKSGSTMTGALTLNADPSSNLHAATKQYVDAVAGSATAAASSATAAAASYDSFDDRYLGAKSSAPSLDNDGNALIEGALYWNSVDNAMYAWTGTEWGSISSTAAIYRYKFVATGGETSVSGTDANGLTLSYLAGKEQVYLNGVLLVRGSDYTASNGTSITSLAALAASDVLEIITFTAFDLATAIANTVFDAKGDLLVASAADTVGKLSVGTNGYYLKANSGAALGVEWAAVDALPSQTGNAGEFLTTDGSTASWAAVDAVPLTTINAKGDLLAGTADNAVTRVAVGANDTVLTADSSTASGVKWAAVSGGKGVLFTVASGATADTYTGTYSFASGSYFIPYFSNVLSSTVGGQTITSGNSLTTLTTAQTSVSIVPNRSWTERSGISTNTAYALAYGAGLWVMGQSNAALGTSTDLITWTSRDSKFAGSDIFNGHYANGYFVIVGGTGRCSTSTDGITWTSRGINFGTTAVYGITYGTQWVAVGNTGKISYTTDVTNQWSAAAAMGTSTWNSVAYGNSVYVAVGGAGVAMSSTDGITWTTRSSGTGNNLRDIIYGDKFVAVGDSSTIHTSTNGITWTARTSPASQDWGQVIYGNGAYIIGGYNGAAAGSTDGITWTTRNINIGAVGTYGGFFGNNTYVFGTGNGRSTSASTANLGYGASTSVGYVLYQPTDSVTAI